MSTTNILDLNNRVSALEKAVSGGDSTQANKADIATEFSTTTAYTAGCFVYHEGKLYIFNVDHAAGAWDATEVSEANVTDEVTSNKAAIDALDDRVEVLETTPRGYNVIATFTGDGVKTYGDVITAFLSYISLADLIMDAGNVYYPRNNVVYFSVNISGTGACTVYVIRLDADNPQWKAINVGSGTEADYLSQVVPSGRVIQLCKKL